MIAWMSYCFSNVYAIYDILCSVQLVSKKGLFKEQWQFFIQKSYWNIHVGRMHTLNQDKADHLLIQTLFATIDCLFQVCQE